MRIELAYAVLVTLHANHNTTRSVLKQNLIQVEHSLTVYFAQPKCNVSSVIWIILDFPSPDGCRFFCHWCWSLAREYISTIFVYTQPRLSTLNVHRSNWFHIEKAKKQIYPSKTMTDADYTDDQTLPTNTPVHPESILHRLGQAVRGIGLWVNANKADYMCFKQKGAITTMLPASRISRQIHKPWQHNLIYVNIRLENTWNCY